MRSEALSSPLTKPGKRKLPIMECDQDEIANTNTATISWFYLGVASGRGCTVGPPGETLETGCGPMKSGVAVTIDKMIG